MKKVLFFALLFVILGVASVSAQVRIGGDGEPNEAAVLDLNADDATNTGTKGLALPRVSLDSDDAILAGTSNILGMLVYNTNAGMTGGVGVYYWDGEEWVKPAGSATVADGSITASKLAQMGAASGQVLKWNGTSWTPAADNNDNTTYTGSTSITLSGNSFQRAALTGDVTADANSNATSIAAGAVSKSKTKLQLYTYSATIGAAVGSTADFTYPPGCDMSNSWAIPIALTAVSAHMASALVRLVRLSAGPSSSTASVAIYCFL